MRLWKGDPCQQCSEAPIADRLTALRIALLELNVIPESEHLRQLRHILVKRILELERLRHPGNGAAHIKNHRYNPTKNI